MELIEYEQVIPENNCLCKVFHSQLIENEKENLHANLGPLPHWHSSYEFNVCINGKLEHHIGNDIQFLESEEFIFINPNVVHVSYEVTEDYLGFAVLVPEEYIRTYCNSQKKKQLVIFTEEDIAPHRSEIWRLLYHLYRYSLSDGNDRIIGMNSCVLSIFSLLLSGKKSLDSEDEEPNPSYELNGSQYTDYVNAHYKENLQLSDVASHFGFTNAYFSRLFYRETGRNFKFYLSSLRLSHATYLLEHRYRSMSISEIAEESGFPNLRAFTDLFMKINGISPSEYLNQHLKRKKGMPGHDQ